MKYVMTFLIAGLLIKDVVPLGDTYIIRGITECLALGVGFWWVLTGKTSDVVKKYSVICLYIVVLFLSMTGAEEPLHVALQTLSVTAIVLFFIACMESQTDPNAIHEYTSAITIYSLSLICIGSLVLYKISPYLAYDHTIEGYSWGSADRFKGLFGKPAMMAASAGILVGMCIFTRTHFLIRSVGILASVPCLFLTGSRSFWAAAVVATALTAGFYINWKRSLLVVCIVVFSGGVLLAFGEIKPSSSTQNRMLRAESLEKLSGRTTLWTLALAHFQNRPLLGYGFTQAHTAFYRADNTVDTSADGVSLFDGDHRRAVTMHNGYVQALLDSGILGAFFYLNIVMISIWRVMRHDSHRLFGNIMYVLLFLSISNGGETVIFSAAEFHSMFFWYAAVLAFSLTPVLVKNGEADSPLLGLETQASMGTDAIACRG